MTDWNGVVKIIETRVSTTKYNITAPQTAASEMNTQLNQQLSKLVQTKTEYYNFREAQIECRCIFSSVLRNKLATECICNITHHPKLYIHENMPPLVGNMWSDQLVVKKQYYACASIHMCFS